MSVVVHDTFGDTATEVSAGQWAQQLELSFPVFADTTGAFFAEWDPEGVLPVAYIIDRDGIVVWTQAGGSSELEAIESQVSALLADEPSSTR
jgi:hypothetical protein